MSAYEQLSEVVQEPLPVMQTIALRVCQPFYKDHSRGRKPCVDEEKNVSVNPFLAFARTTVFLTKALGFRGRGS